MTDRRYFCHTCKQGVRQAHKLEHTRRGHILVGRSRRRRPPPFPLTPPKIYWGELWHTGPADPTAPFPADHAIGWVVDVLVRTTGKRDGVGIEQVDLATDDLELAKRWARWECKSLPKDARLYVRGKEWPDISDIKEVPA